MTRFDSFEIIGEAPSTPGPESFSGEEPVMFGVPSPGIHQVLGRSGQWIDKPQFWLCLALLLFALFSLYKLRFRRKVPCRTEPRDDRLVDVVR